MGIEIKLRINKVIFNAVALLLVISCATGASQVSIESYKQIDGIYKEEEGSKWIEFNNGHFSYNYNVPNHMPMFSCKKLSYGKYKVIDDKFIELNSSDSILHRRSVYIDEVRTNKGNQDSIYIEIKKSEDYITLNKGKEEAGSSLDYMLSYGWDNLNFANKNHIQVKKIDDDFAEIWLTVKVKNFPFYYSDGRYRGLTDLIVIIEMEDYNHFEIDLSPYDECTLFQEYYNEEIIRLEKNKIYWNGEVYIKKE